MIAGWRNARRSSSCGPLSRKSSRQWHSSRDSAGSYQVRVLEELYPRLKRRPHRRFALRYGSSSLRIRYHPGQSVRPAPGAARAVDRGGRSVGARGVRGVRDQVAPGSGFGAGRAPIALESGPNRGTDYQAQAPEAEHVRPRWLRPSQTASAVRISRSLNSRTTRSRGLAHTPFTKSVQEPASRVKSKDPRATIGCPCTPRSLNRLSQGVFRKACRRASPRPLQQMALGLRWVLAPSWWAHPVNRPVTGSSRERKYPGRRRPRRR
jgi:hypothetical protein